MMHSPRAYFFDAQEIRDLELRWFALGLTAGAVLGGAVGWLVARVLA